MKHQEDTFTNAEDIKIFYQSWHPDGAPKAVVQFMHGYASHSGRVSNIVNELVPRGYVVYAADHQGHGKSGERFAYVKKYEDFVEDQKIFFDLIEEKEPNLPHFIMGHSMGSAIARLYCAKYPEGLKGLVLSGAGIKEAGKSPIIKGLAKFLNLFIPKKAPLTIDVSEEISRDPEVVKAYQDDPLVIKKPTVRMGVVLLKVFKKANEVADQIKVPTLMQSGSKDSLILETQELADLMTMEDKTVKIYEGLYHEVYNELEKDRKVVLKDLGDWLDNHI